MTTTVCVVGTVATTPKLISTPGKVTLCTFRIAATERKYDRERSQWVDGETNWMTVNTFRGLADHSAASFSTGDRVIVNGRLRVRAWETEEKSGTSVEVEADAIGHDLRWGTSTFAKQNATPPPIESDASATPASPGAFADDALTPSDSGWSVTPAPSDAAESAPFGEGDVAEADALLNAA
ncbi:single-stranded DNA-binding protein [Leucobacter musarum]|uniref:single-stranded DNA-binding protein n=1 Tax=Leucobacter musarum TaxID=1930747 RepID=UPI0006A7BFF5|nr:single-stranded DNA-binding protein [Leucobacter musarum]